MSRKGEKGEGMQWQFICRSRPAVLRRRSGVIAVLIALYAFSLASEAVSRRKEDARKDR